MALQVNVSASTGHNVKTFGPREKCSYSQLNGNCFGETSLLRSPASRASSSSSCNSHWSDDEVPSGKKMKVTENKEQGLLRQQVIFDTENEKAFSFSKVKQPPINGESEKMSPKMTYGSKVNPSSSLVASLKWDESVFSNLDESYRLWQKEKCNISPSASPSSSYFSTDVSSSSSLAGSSSSFSSSSCSSLTTPSSTSAASVVSLEEASIETAKCIQVALHNETKQLTKEQQMLDEQINLVKKLIVYTFSHKINRGTTNLPLTV